MCAHRLLNLPTIALLALLMHCEFATNLFAQPDFETAVRPIFKQHCVSCHGKDKQESGLRLDSRKRAMMGSDGKAIVPRDLDSSVIWQRVNETDPEQRMPPKGNPLSKQELDTIRAWIESGAEWPETQEDRDLEKDARFEHWAWQPIKSPSLPMVRGKNWVRGPIDSFVLASIESHGLSPSAEADKRTLIRRLYLDLLGLPPSYEEVERFLNDTKPDAYERLLESLLASPHYGERWARHWLDIAHYADTHGFERDQKREHAWRYRDYVINAFNRDKPYDQFLKEQIAGDALNPNDPQHIIATGFLAAGPWDFVGQAETPSPVIKRLARADDLDDMVTQVLTASSAVTINCARCHDHKLDPISQREYYSLWAAFAGAKRANRVADPGLAAAWEDQKKVLERSIEAIKKEIAELQSDRLNLADIVGGGNGKGSGTKRNGIHVLTGKPQLEMLGYLDNVVANQFHDVDGPWIDGVFVPDGSDQAGIVFSSTGLRTKAIPPTEKHAWDAIRNGLVNQQKSSRIGDVDYDSEGHSLIGLHANAAITLDLQAFRDALKQQELIFQSDIGYGGRPDPVGDQSADVRLLLDGEQVFLAEKLNPNSARISIKIPIPASAHFLTLVSTDAGNDIGFDQVFFADPSIGVRSAINAETQSQLDRLQFQLDKETTALKQPPEFPQVYAIQSESPPAVSILKRGSPEQPGDEVDPISLACLSPRLQPSPLNGESDAARRLKVAEWLTSRDHPTMRRVIVNRLWQHHFGVGIVDTPSDFGLGGSKPSHPELLDWLAMELLRNDYSLKALHWHICSSSTYRQVSQVNNSSAAKIDGSNRLLWRQNSRRVDAETLRDSVLAVTSSLSSSMYGPGFQDFDYQEEYAPIYEYVVPNRPELWKRSIYRFVVRTTPHPFLTPLDCPNPANLSPTRNTTTTAVQSLALWNNGFILSQSRLLGEQIERESLPVDEQIRRVFTAVLARSPSRNEIIGARELLKNRGLDELGRALINSNEFSMVD